MLAVVGPDQPLTDDVGEEPNFEDAIGPSATVERAPAEVKVEVFWSGADEICVCSDQLGQDGDNVEERTESIEFRDEQKQKRREKQDEKEGRKQKLKRKRTEEREQDQDQEQQQEQEQEEEQKRKRKQKRKHMQEQKGEQEKEQEQEQEQGQGRKVELKFTGKRRVAELKGDTFPPSQASQVGSPVALEPGAIVYAQWDDMLWYRGIVSLVFLAESTETQEGSTKEAPMVVDGRSFPNATRLTVKLDDGTVCVCGDDEVVSLAQFPTKVRSSRHSSVPRACRRSSLRLPPTARRSGHRPLG
jgi:outer membrane biosynthesis protein TonB